jgi:dihydroxyacid dehydratase/phosphogluconate dehydratase
MLHLAEANLLDLSALTVTGRPLGEILEWWKTSERRARVRALLKERDAVEPDDVIIPPAEARRRGLTSTVCFPTGNLCPEGAVIKATAIDPAVVDTDGVYRKTGPAKVFTSERDAIAAIKGQSTKKVEAGDVLVLIGRGPMGSGMEETYQITSALKFLKWGREVAVVTDARFSGVSTGACIGHVGPEALAGGPIGKLQDGDVVQIIVDRNQLMGSVDLVGETTGGTSRRFSAAEGAAILADRPARSDLRPDPNLPPETRLWAALQQVSGGTWSGCVYDVDRILAALGQSTS